MNDSRLVAQVAAESGASDDAAALALYLRQCADAGRTTEQAAYLIGRTRAAVLVLCRRWAIGFVDAPIIPEPRTGAPDAPVRLSYSDAPAAPPAGVSAAARVGSCPAAHPQTGARP